MQEKRARLIIGWRQLTHERSGPSKPRPRPAARPKPATEPAVLERPPQQLD